jgi:hypothetical protein
MFYWVALGTRREGGSGVLYGPVEVVDRSIIIVKSQLVKHSKTSAQIVAVRVITTHDSQGYVAMPNAEFQVCSTVGVVVSFRKHICEIRNYCCWIEFDGLCDMNSLQYHFDSEVKVGQVSRFHQSHGSITDLAQLLY